MKEKEAKGVKFIEKTCPICGKTFLLLSHDWVYKIRGKKDYEYVCSYHCMLKGDNAKHYRKI